MPYLPGLPAAQASSFDPAGAAAAVGGFLGALHVPAPADAPANPFRGVPLADRAGSFAANLAVVTGEVGRGLADRDAVLRAWDAALAAPGYDGPPVWLHGDLHPANILVNDGQVSGVIDFGDITAGDPAGDLSVAWMLLPLGCHDSFWSANPDGRRRRRAGRRRPSDAGQRLGTELRDRVSGPLGRQSGTPGSRPLHPQHRAGGSARTSWVKTRAPGPPTAKWLTFAGRRAPASNLIVATETEPAQVTSPSMAQIRWHRTQRATEPGRKTRSE